MKFIDKLWTGKRFVKKNEKLMEINKRFSWQWQESLILQSLTNNNKRRTKDVLLNNREWKNTSNSCYSSCFEPSTDLVTDETALNFTLQSCTIVAWKFTVASRRCTKKSKPHGECNVKRKFVLLIFNSEQKKVFWFVSFP